MGAVHRSERALHPCRLIAKLLELERRGSIGSRHEYTAGAAGVQLQLGLMSPEVGRFHGELDERVWEEERQRGVLSSQPSIDHAALAADVEATTALL